MTGSRMLKFPEARSILARRVLELSLIHIFRYRKYQSPVLSAAKAIRLAAALVSLLSLETAILTRFGDDEVFRRLMTASTGAGVCIIVLGISVYMIVRATRKIHTLNTD